MKFSSRQLTGVMLTALIAAFAFSSPLSALPKEDVIEVPAIGERLSVHNLFQSNMVLQRDKPVAVWGWATPGEEVTVTFGGEKQSTKAGEDRRWKVELPAMPANSEPQTLLVKGNKTTLTLDNILVGDVWLLGGQSNMEFPISKVENGNLEIVSANFPQIRILTVPAQDGPKPKIGFPRLHEWSSWSNRHFRKGDWEVCSPETVTELSAIGYVFARRLQMTTQIPIGVVDVSRGGTTVETWTPNDVLETIDTQEVKTLLANWDTKVAEWDPQADLEKRIQNHNNYVERMKKEGKSIPADRTVPTDLRPGPIMDQNKPGNCYASMIAPIAGFAVKGAIFHQGYNNCFNGSEGARMYGQVFPHMITAWRNAFNDPEMPFGILSLCTAGTYQNRENFTSLMSDVGPLIREAQYQTFLHFYNQGDKNIGFTSTYDLRRRWYHPQLKLPAGERIARWALATQYGYERNLSWKPPMIEKMSVEEGRLVLKMDGLITGVDNGGPIEGFAIAGEDRRFHPADADYLVIGKDDRGRERKDQSTLVLTSPMVPHPVHFRYAWARNPMGNLQANRNSDVPFATQRSDDWQLENVPLGVLGETLPETIDRGHRRKIQEALTREDTRRRLNEAERFLKENQEQVTNVEND